ncbi:hypothetical protein B0H14DRAFT_3135188 [Mycena olivaceomarginata]|nr:hypothetical protein B0H14DRAFT_3135188 [Mycena olivaceomarginata]
MSTREPKKPVRGQFHFDASSDTCPQRQGFAGLQIPSRITYSFVFLASMGGRSAAVSSSMESAFTVLGSLSGLIRYLAASCISSHYWCYILSTLVAGLLSGWGIGIGAMRAANAVRNQALIQAAEQQIKASINVTAVFQANPALAQTTAVFSGLFLDVRYCALPREPTAVYGAFLVIGAFIFGAMRVWMSSALLVRSSLPSVTPSSNQWPSPFGCYMAIVVVTTILIFPQTMSHAVMDTAADAARARYAAPPDAGYCSQRTAGGIELAHPEVQSAASSAHWDSATTCVCSGVSVSPRPSGFLSLEFTYGRWSGDDASLLNFDRLVGSVQLASTTSGSTDSPTAPTARDTYLLHQIRTCNAEREATHSVRPEDVMPVLNAATSKLRVASAAALSAVRNMIELLRAALVTFEAAGQSVLLAPFLSLLQEAATDEIPAHPPLRALFVAYVFAADVLGIARAVLAVVDIVCALDKERTKSRLWAPTGLRSLWSLLVKRGDKTDGTFGEDTSQPVKPARESQNYHFYYVEKGIWALIMAQTTLNISAADQIFNYFTRLLGTLVGLAIGLLAWYAGNGKGNGNPYGSAVAVGVCIIPLLFIRIFAPGTTTFALVVGYSWIDGHAVQFTSPERRNWLAGGVETLGAGDGIIHPNDAPSKSGRKAVRQRNAVSIAVLGEVYASLISIWISKQDTDSARPTQWTAHFRARLMALADEIGAIRVLTELAKWEGSIRGKWPAADSQPLSAISRTNWRVNFVHSSKVLNPNFSLRTGEPLNLLDRLFYHHAHSRTLVSAPDKKTHLEEIKSPSYIYYASAMIAVYQLLAVGTVRRGAAGGLRELAGEYDVNHSV